MQEQRSIKEIKWWFAELCHEDDVDRYLKIFPEFDSNLSKFAIGVLLWEIKGMVNLKDITDVEKIQFILKVLKNSPMAYAIFDNTFCEASFDTTFQLITNINEYEDTPSLRHSQLPPSAPGFTRGRCGSTFR